MRLFLVVCAIVMSAIAQASEDQPEIMGWVDGYGNPVKVEVYTRKSCPFNPAARACADTFNSRVYLNGDKTSLSHELAHIAGMRHTPWYYNGLGVPCARVLVADSTGHYKQGQLICVGFNGSEFSE